MGLLDGDLASIVADALTAAELTKPAVLTKVTPGTRTPGAISAGTNPTTVSYNAKGIEQDLLSLQLAGTLIAGVDWPRSRRCSTLRAGDESGTPDCPGRHRRDARQAGVQVAGADRVTDTRDPNSTDYLEAVNLAVNDGR